MKNDLLHLAKLALKEIEIISNIDQRPEIEIYQDADPIRRGLLNGTLRGFHQVTDELVPGIADWHADALELRAIDE